VLAPSAHGKLAAFSKDHPLSRRTEAWLKHGFMHAVLLRRLGAVADASRVWKISICFFFFFLFNLLSWLAFTNYLLAVLPFTHQAGPSLLKQFCLPFDVISVRLLDTLDLHGVECGASQS
jgi:hypothetical protein